ncbi:TVP38/TMEM64 family protein [Romeria aff. gracilis LEGE 07310]|uniref:TVP38/TMEM64 family membrane protein n=1 Tax=Vasconcelosia minhoensis LEGE 07310 TaxID=915328 RepID=A0A8J7A6M1_9CYAN|nr:TVP38/TMEM64 family protein [Romeria gracilis]MBE9076930.1 TVP38/TMEM64 family protein [Romeria aff. gracilis LEGE 07310]
MKPRKWLLGLLAIGVLLACCWQKLLLLFDHEALIQHFDPMDPWSTGLFVAAHILATSIGVPGTLLVIVGGAVYGLIWGTFLSVVGATLGAISAFWIARYWLHDWFAARFSQSYRYRQLKGMMQKEALSCVLTIRFVPISPFNLENFLFGLTPVPFRAYALGTFIGIIPGTLAYTWVGVSGMQALHGQSLVPLLLALSLLALLSVMPILARRYRQS